MGKQTVAVLAVLAYTFTVTFAIAKVLDMTMGLRVDKETESEGLDVSIHGERAYVLETIELTSVSASETEVAVAAEAMAAEAVDAKA